MKRETDFINKMRLYFSEHDFSEQDLKKIETFLSEYKKEIAEEIESKQKPIIIYRDVIKERVVVVHKSITGELIKPADRPPIEMIKVTAERIVDNACTYLNIKREDIMARGRKRPNVLARQMIFALLRLETFLTLHEIGRIFGMLDHTTVIHGIKTLNNLMSTNKNLNDTFLGLHKFVTEKTEAA